MKRKRFTEEERNRAIYLARQTSAKNAAKVIGCSASAISHWHKRKFGVPLHDSMPDHRYCYDEEFKSDAIEAVIRKGIVYTSNEIGVSIPTLRRWVRNANRYKEAKSTNAVGPSYTAAEREDAVYVALEKGLSYAASYIGASKQSVMLWAKKMGVYEQIRQRRSYSDRYKANAKELAKDVGVVKAAKELNINKSNVYSWFTRNTIDIYNIRRHDKDTYNRIKRDAIEYAKKTSIKEASKKYNIAHATIKYWIMKSEEK